jgi:hypothetical protein
MASDDQMHKRELVDIHTRNLQELQKQAAIFGLYCPPHIANEIADLQAKIAQLSQEIDDAPVHISPTSALEPAPDEPLPIASSSQADVTLPTTSQVIIARKKGIVRNVEMRSGAGSDQHISAVDQSTIARVTLHASDARSQRVVAEEESEVIDTNLGDHNEPAKSSS